MAGLGISLEIDSSDLQAKMAALASCFKDPNKFNNRMAGVMRRAGKHVKKVMREDLPKKYYIKSPEVGRAVRSPKVQVTGLGAGCTVPVVGERRHIGGGGRGYRAYGYRYGWNSLKGKYTVSADIVKGKRTKLPYKSEQTGMPPFRNMPGTKLNTIAYARVGKPQLPIEALFGPAIPQMPLNRAEGEVRSDIEKFLIDRVTHEINVMLAGVTGIR